MKKLVLFGSVLITALASCNNDVTTDVMPKAEEGTITMNAFVPKMSRGSDVDLTTLQTNGFNVFAYKAPTNGTYESPFIDNVKFSYNASNVWVSSPVYYWPQYALDFFCYYPDLVTASTTTPATFNYTVKPTAADQEDILMTYAANKTQPTSGNALDLAFHHALSKINFVVQTKSGSGLNVSVKNVSMTNVNMTGTITYKTAATSMPYFTTSALSAPGNPVNTPAAPITLTAAATGAPNASSAPIQGMFLLPQPLTCWTYSATDAKDMKGTYINIEGSLTGVTDYTGNIAIPITTTEWAPGYSYTYTILFGGGGSTGGGGYNPNKPNPNDPNKPQQILVPIEISVTVDKWVDFTPPIDVNL